MDDHQRRVLDTIVASEWTNPLNRSPIQWKAEHPPGIGEPTCIRCMVNPASYDSEPPNPSYGYDCETCFWVRTSGPMHLHTQKYWPEYIAAHIEREPHVATHTWQTLYHSSAVFSRPGIQCGWFCTTCEDVLPINGHSVAFVQFAMKRMSSRYDRA